MVISPPSSRLNRLVGPWLLRIGIGVQSKVVAFSGKPASNYYFLDHLLLMPLAQKIISIEVQNLAQQQQAISEGQKLSRWRAFKSYFVDRIWGKGVDEIDDAARSDLNESKPSVIRLEIFESYIRPVLLPNEQWSDVLRWSTMSHLKNWVRSEFLIAKYGADVGEALVAYPQLRLSPQIRSMKNRKRLLLRLFGMLPDSDGERRLSLPSSPILVRAFRMERWNNRKDFAAQLRHRKELCSRLGGEIGIHDGFHSAELPLDTDLSSLSLEDVLELTLGHIVGCGPFNALCEDAGIFQLWTRDYISGLAGYLRKRSEKFQGKTIVLDIGAGDGVLAHALTEVWKDKQNSNLYPTVIATDNGSWGIPNAFPVEKCSVNAALAKYCRLPGQQIIVLCSWMPPSTDWTALFRQFEVDEYILIGECDDDTCGRNDSEGGRSTLLAPYAMDGYKRQELHKLVPYQFGKLDTAFSRSSTTISFSRIRR